MAELVEHMIDRLSKDDDGKAKTFKTSTVENFKEFADLFAARNLTGDSELAALVEKAQKVMSGVDAKSLRTDAGARHDRVRHRPVAILLWNINLKFGDTPPGYC
jgi:hypothetical protein